MNINKKTMEDCNKCGFLEQIEDILISRTMQLRDTLQVFELEMSKKNEVSQSSDTRYGQILEEIPDVFTESYFISIFRFFEYGLKIICKNIQYVFDEKLTLVDLSGKGIKEYNQFLIKEIKFNANNELWGKIIYYRDLRNYIVHSDSFLSNINYNKEQNKDDKKKNELLKKIKQYNYNNLIEIKNNGTIYISYKILENMLIDFDDYLRTVFAEIKTISQEGEDKKWQ